MMLIKNISSAALFLWLQLPAQAAIDYSINEAIGTGSVTGTFTTDGTLGVISSENFADWNVVFTSGSLSINLLGPLSGNNSSISVFGSSLTATVSDLQFDFSNEHAAGFILHNPYIPYLNWLTFEGVYVSGIGGSACSENLFLDGSQILLRTGIQSVATSAVPEPSTYLAGIGSLGIFGLFCWKNRK